MNVMATCTTCGRTAAGDFPFCPYCGSALPHTPPPREQRKRVTILFCDVTGSTALGESTDPEALRALLARYFERMKGIIESHGGTVEKFIGDAVMAVFGVPVLHEDDAARACRAALEMQAALPELGIACRIGVDSGEVVTGTAERLVTGDAVNVAARLEQAAGPGEVLVGEETYRLVRDSAIVVPIDPLALKGKSEPVPAFRLVSISESGSRRRPRTPMVGRERELDRLQDAFAQAVDDRSCQLFTVLGSAGVGKSRLALEFLQGVERAQVVSGRCLSYGQGITYSPVVDVIMQLDARPADDYAAATLQSLLGEKTMATSPEEIAWAVRVMLEEQAEREPLVVVFDDVHWGEETFLDLIEHVADLARDAPILLLCMARLELLEKRPGWGGGKWNATTVLLEPLNGEETDRLVDALGGVSEEMRERIRLAAEGNPLFVEEMLALIRESGGQDVLVPPTIHALLATRLDQLQLDERHVLEVGSVEGRVFHRSAVQVLAPEEGNLHGKLLGLVRKELVRPERAQMRGDEAYRFRHLLIRDAAYESLSKATRAELHERFAGWLEERGANLVELDELVGYHLEQAARYRQELGRPAPTIAERAGERLGVAGTRALRRGDQRAARALLERALALLRPLRLDVDLELSLADTRPMTSEAAAIAQAAAERATAAGDRRGEALARVMAAYHRMLTGEGTADELEALAHNALPVLEAVDDHAGLMRIWRALSFVVGNHWGRYEEWTRATEQAMYHARQIGETGLLDFPSMLILGPGPADEILQTLEPLLDETLAPGHRLAQAVLLAMLGRFDDAWSIKREVSERLLAISDESGDAAAAEIAAMAGEYETAARHMRAFCDWLEATGNIAALSTCAPQLGRILCMLGRYDEAEPLARQGRELGDEHDVTTQILWRQTQALVLASRGEHGEAERLAREAVAIIGETDALSLQGDALWDLAEVLWQVGREEEARDTLTQALDRYGRKKNLAMAAQVRRRLEV